MSALGRIWHLMNLPCEGMSRLACESLDRELSPTERFALRSHFLYCAACRRYSRQIALLSRSLRLLASRLDTDLPLPLPGPGLPADARARIHRALDGE